MKTSATRLVWIKRRARCIQNYYQVTRRLAIYDAWIDWIYFTGARHENIPNL